MANITFVVAEITFKVAVITFLVVKITYVVTSKNKAEHVHMFGLDRHLGLIYILNIIFKHSKILLMVSLNNKNFE